MIATKLAATLIIIALAGWRGTESIKQDACSLIRDTTCEGPKDLECIAECPVGYRKSKDLDFCEPCSPGSFKNSTGDLDCLACPIGTFANKTGSTACSQCPAGTFASKTGSTSCSLCGKGAFSSSDGVSCKPCQAGSYSSGSGSSACTKCVAGTYSSSSGSTSCSKCVPGTYSSRDGATECEKCDLKFALRRYSGMTQCDLCPNNTNSFGPSKCYPARLIGCFKDKGNPRDLGLFEKASNETTPEYCVKLCKSKGYAYAGVQAHDWCYCGNSYGRFGPVKHNECSMKCKGDSKKTCGNHWKNEIYSTGINPVKRLGCFKDEASTDLPIVKKFDTNTPQICVEHCEAMGKVYAGVQAHDWCHCGDSYGLHGKVPDSECTMKCKGDSSQTCGNKLRKEIYSTGINPGNRK